MPIYKVTTKLLGTILVEAESKGDVLETINEDRVTSIEAYQRKEEEGEKKTALEKVLIEAFKADSIWLWRSERDRTFKGDYKGKSPTASTVRGVLSIVIPKDILNTPEATELVCMVNCLLERFPVTPIILGAEDGCFKVVFRDVKSVSTTLKGALENVYNELFK